MTPQVPQQQQPIQLTGKTTTITGIISIIGGCLGLFTQIFAALHGTPIDPTTFATSGAATVAGVGLVKAADSKQ